MRELRIGAGIVAAGLMLVGAAQAADLYVPPVEQYVPEIASSPWSTCYVGVPVSYTTGRTPSTAPLSDFSSPLGGFPIGLQAGCDYVPDGSPLLLGVVVDAFLNGPAGTSPTIDLGAGLTGTSSSSIPVFGTVRARAGVAVDETLFYVAAGVAIANVNNTITTSTPLTQTISNTHIGWAAGGGIEHKVTENVSLFAEYQYVDLGSKNYTYLPPFGFGGTDTLSLHPAFHQVKVGLNYRF